MNNEELKKKIADIVLGVEWTGCLGNTYHISGGMSVANAIADALSAAGIGDVKELQLDKKAYEAASNHYRILFEEQQRRAEVAERALRDAFEIICNGIYDVNEEVAEALKQAEKELAEERE